MYIYYCLLHINTYDCKNYEYSFTNIILIMFRFLYDIISNNNTNKGSGVRWWLAAVPNICVSSIEWRG